MRCIVIALLFFGCKATAITGQINPPSFIILVQYNKPEAENNVLHILNRMTAVRHFDIRHGMFSCSEIEAVFSISQNTKTDILREELQQTAGVYNVVVNPRY